MFYRLNIWLAVLSVTAMLSACSPSIREAQDVVAQADSLWHAGQMYGVDAGDSATLAQAYETLDTWQWVEPDAYAHACYHYGKLLRAKGNPVAAMEVFINATHSRTRDYHILGRVYNNMGGICHLAGEYALSYDMFERSSKMYLRNGNSLLYYYCLNDMALELAVKAYLRCMQCDTTIIYAHLSKQYLPSFSGTTLQLAQAYSMLGKRDSATYYANIVLSYSHSLFEKNNALYILTNDDETKDKKEIRETAADRSDVQKRIEIYQGKLSQAVQLLEQDINRKPNWTWLYAIIATIICSGGVFYWRYRIHKRQMNTHIEQLVERQTDAIIQSIKKHIDINNLRDTLHWKDYPAMKADADLYMGGIVSKLESKYLNETEIRFCILTMLDFTLSHIAETIHYGYPSGIKTLKKRISVKLGTTPPKLHDFLLYMATKA